MDNKTVTMAHGAGGRQTSELIDEVFKAHFANPDLTADDAAVLVPPAGKMAVSTDGFIVSPAFFPGGNIGNVYFSGTTTLCLLRFLVAKKRITIITHSLGALSEASKYDNLNIISLGGIYSPTTDSFVGLSAIEALSSMRINKAFMGATGVSLTAGMTNTTFLEAEIKRAVVHRADSIYGMADSSKIGREAIVTFCHLKDLTAFITDREPPKEYVDLCRQENVKLRYE